jgi:hypothetical protein
MQRDLAHMLATPEAVLDCQKTPEERLTKNDGACTEAWRWMHAMRWHCKFYQFRHHIKGCKSYSKMGVNLAQMAVLYLHELINKTTLNATKHPVKARQKLGRGGSKRKALRKSNPIPNGLVYISPSSRCHSFEPAGNLVPTVGTTGSQGTSHYLGPPLGVDIAVLEDIASQFPMPPRTSVTASF